MFISIHVIHYRPVMRHTQPVDSIKPSELMTGDTLPQFGNEPLKYEQAMLPNFPVNLYEDEDALKVTGWNIAKAGQSCGNATELPNILNIR